VQTLTSTKSNKTDKQKFLIKCISIIFTPKCSHLRQRCRHSCSSEHDVYELYYNKIRLKGGLQSYVMVAVHCTNLLFVMVLTSDIIFHTSDIGRGRPNKNTPAS